MEYKVRLTENIQSLTHILQIQFSKSKGRDDFLIRGLSETQTNTLKLLLDAKLDSVQNTKDTEQQKTDNVSISVMEVYSKNHMANAEEEPWNWKRALVPVLRSESISTLEKKWGCPV